MTDAHQALIARMLDGDRGALAKLITLVENRAPDRSAIMSRLHDRCGHGYTIGITGPPGAGKSTLVDQLIGRYRQQGQQVGVVAVDPSSPFSGGAVLGDRIRMQNHYLDDGVFIRSLSSRGSVGGLARAARDVARLLDAAGKHIIVVETVGVGQTEFDIVRLADTVVVVLVPEAGDTVQAMKAGLLEIADLFVVNKADREGAMRIKAELEAMLQLRPAGEWAVPVIPTVANEGQGVDDLMAAIAAHRTFLTKSGLRRQRAAHGRREEFLSILKDEVSSRLEKGAQGPALQDLLARVEQGDIDPYAAVLQVMDDEDLKATLLRSARTGAGL